MSYAVNPCIFCERPKDCQFWSDVGSEGCTADDWYLVACFLDHYGNDLKPSADIRVVDTALHLVMANDKEMSGPGAYDLPKERRITIYGQRG